MAISVVQLEWRKEQLWRGCILAAIAHAIMVAKYPNLSNEHSWDGLNYSVQNSAGMRGTVTFDSEYCVAAFRNEHSERMNNMKDANEYFISAPKEIIKLAQEEALQYLLENIEGKTMPFVTTGFWGIGEKLFTSDTFEDMLENGAILLHTQTLTFDEGINVWKEYYDMSIEQCGLLNYLYKRKIAAPEKKLILTKDEIKRIGAIDEEGLKESKNSFYEINIIWDEQ